MSNQRSLAIIFLIIFVNLLGFGIVIPLLPLYASDFQATGLQIGLLFASYSICQIVAAPILGSLSDRVGRRPILLLSLLGTVISFVMLALAGNLFWLFAARIVDGLSGGNISTARAYISDITAKEDRAKAYGIIGAAFGLGFVFGPAMAGVLGMWGHQAPAWAAAALALVALLLTYFWLAETNHRSVATQRRMPWRDIPMLVTRPVIGPLLLMDFVYWSAFSVFQTTFALFGNARFGWNVSQVGWVLAMVGFIGAIIQGGAVGPIVRRYGEKRTYLVGIILAVLGLGWAAFAYDWRIFIVALIPASIGSALSNPTLVSMISLAGDQQAQGRAQGVSGAMESLGRAVGPIWGNGMLGVFGEGSAYLSAAAVLGLLALWGVQLPQFKRGREHMSPAPLATPASDD
ncbi:MAG: MFS transporter [Caldilineaceae bacterium]